MLFLLVAADLSPRAQNLKSVCMKGPELTPSGHDRYQVRSTGGYDSFGYKIRAFSTIREMPVQNVPIGLSLDQGAGKWTLKRGSKGAEHHAFEFMNAHMARSQTPREINS